MDKGAPLSLEEKINAHEAFLTAANAQRDTLHQLYGFLFLADDYAQAQDLAEATRYLLRAESMAKAAGNAGWQGWVSYRRGTVAVRLKNYEEALKFYESAASRCGEAGDSLCLAESLEQASVMYGMLNDFVNAIKLNAEAMPLLEKFGGERQLATALGNFGIIHSLQKRYAEAIPYFERAIELQRKLDDKKGLAKAMNNLANAYRNLGRYNLAMATFQRCVDYNLEHGFQENLVNNYVGLGLTYDSIGDFRSSRIYFEKHEVLKDSLIGAETQRKIAELEVKYKTQQQELELERSNAALQAARNSLERRGFIIGGLLLLAGSGLWLWRWQSRQDNRELALNQENLANLTQILQRKNKQLITLEERLSEQSASLAAAASPEDFMENIYGQRILTDADWAAFKVYFEKAYPGYMLRLRRAFPTLTDAEERLFLLLKLRLNTKEIASILGISTDSVKRTRNRLRKRLELGEEVELDNFVWGFWMVKRVN